MKLLLDTVTFLWILGDQRRLSLAAREVLAEKDNSFYLSVASAWEIGVKYGKGKLKLEALPPMLIAEQCAVRGIERIGLSHEDIAQIHALPFYHSDPFDRMLICQAAARGMALLTPDPLMKKYAVPVIW